MGLNLEAVSKPHPSAGHCIYDAEECANTAFVFGFGMLSEKTPTLTFDDDQVYFCQEIVGQEVTLFGADWGVYRLDRPVPDRQPLRIRREGKIRHDQNLFVIGYPLGLPAKIVGGGFVRDNTPNDFFVATLDVYGGNSGSCVLNANTLTVEGLIVRGEQDFVQNGDCWVSKRCPENGCTGEDVVRITELQYLVPSNPTTAVYELIFGPCSLVLPQGTTTETSWKPPPLAPNTKYCWQVAVRDECGATLGESWSFTTAPEPVSFIRGDCNGDGDTGGVNDAVTMLTHNFLGGVEVPCQSACDTNGDGATSGVNDAITLLTFNFLGGVSIPPPFPVCDLSTLTTDTVLGCETPPQGCR